MPNEDLNSTPTNQTPTPPVDYNSAYYDPNNNTMPQQQVGSYVDQGVPMPPADAGFYNSASPASPYADYTQQPAYQDPAASTVYGDYTQSNNLETEAPVFEEKKSGNKLVVYGAVGLLVVLVIAAGVLLWLNFGGQTTPTDTANTPPASSNNSNTNNSTNTPATTPSNNSNSTTSTTLTGGANTPATKSRVFNETKAPKTWLKQKFTTAVVDTDGNCIVTNICGDSTDPDSDGLTNIEEYNFQTDPQNGDTDNDGISDGDETYVYYSDPVKDDSDTDTYKDGAELANCYDPILNETGKIGSAKLTDIATQIGLRPLHEKTKATLTTAGATAVDLSSKGVSSVKCAAAASTASTTPATTSSTSGTTPTSPATTTSPTSTNQAVQN